MQKRGVDNDFTVEHFDVNVRTDIWTVIVNEMYTMHSSITQYFTDYLIFHLTENKYITDCVTY
jgi:GTP cyclohydrolase III